MNMINNHTVTPDSVHTFKMHMVYMYIYVTQSDKMLIPQFYNFAIYCVTDLYIQKVQ